MCTRARDFRKIKNCQLRLTNLTDNVMFTCHLVKETYYVLFKQESGCAPVCTFVLDERWVGCRARGGCCLGVSPRAFERPAGLSHGCAALHCRFCGCYSRRAGTWQYERTSSSAICLCSACSGGIGGTLATTTAWGYLEAFVHVPHLQSMWIYPIFWLFVGLSVPVVIMRYR